MSDKKQSVSAPSKHEKEHHQKSEPTPSKQEKRRADADDDHDDHNNEDNDNEEHGSEYEEIDLTENPLYQVLSAFFENERGENLVDHLAKLTQAVETNTKMMEQLLTKKPSSSSKN